MHTLGWSASSYYARARNSAWTAVCGTMLGLACAPSYTRAQAPTKTPDVERSLSSAKKAERLAGAEQVRRGRGVASPAALKRALAAEKDALVRVRLLQGLAASGAEGVVGDLIAGLERDPGAMVRQAAAQELGQYASQPAVVTALAAALRKDPAVEVRYACASSLGLSNTPAAADALDWASRHGDPALRRQAAFSLRRHTGAEAKKTLKRLQGDKDESVRKTAGGKAK